MAVVVVILATRFIVPLFIPRFPLPAILICLVVDAADQTILQTLTDLSLDGYQNYDKALDIYYLTVAYLAVNRNWTNGIAVEVARFLWYYRLIGVLAFEVTQERWVLMLFPNTFEYFFIAYEVVRTCWDPRRMSRRAVIGLAAFIWIFIKLPQEWWIHVAQNDFTDFMKETVFGVDGTSSWGEAFSNRPFVLLAILAAIGAIVFIALRLRKRLRPTDWPFGVDVDRPTPVLDIPEADPHVPSMQRPILEKLVLIGLIGGSFTNVLDVDASGWQVMGATILLVLVNAGASHLMAQRGIEWSSLAVEFVVLAVVNTSLVTVYSRLVGEDGVNRATAWFFGLLLTMIIVLFDRFRTERLARLQPAPVAVPEV
jgi:hypothetical protein